MNKYCMGVVVYNPTISELKNIELYADSGLFGLIMIYDNSPLLSRLEIIGLKKARIP